MESILYRFLLLPSILRAPLGPLQPQNPYFVVPELYARHTYGLDYAVPFRRELSLVVAELLLVDDDGVYRSYFESRPIWEFRNQAKYDQARKLYPDGTSPYFHLLQSVQGCSPKWIAIATSFCWG